VFYTGEHIQDVLVKYLLVSEYSSMKIPKLGRRQTIAIAMIAVFAVYGGYSFAHAMLNVSVSNNGTVVGQQKELTISAGVGGIVSGAVAFGTETTLPVCAAALASSFADIATATISWGANLQSNSDYEIFFCLGNIGTSTGTVHVTTTGASVGETEVFEQAQNSVLGGLSFSSCDGASIAGAGVIAVRGHLHTPTVGLNGVVSLTGKTTFTFS
jgi:hypothetical protein